MVPSPRKSPYPFPQPSLLTSLSVLSIPPSNPPQHLTLGFIGCAIATALIQTLMPTLLFLYVRFIGGMDCWPGFTTRAFQNWGPMIRLALPGLAMVMAEFMAFEILTLASARISATHLAAQTILQSLSVMAYQLPFPLSIAASTRVANFIGAALPDAAKVTMRVAFVGGTILGLFNMVMLSSLREYIPVLYTDEPDVRELAARTLPLNAAFQLLDALAAQGNGVLRGLGKQEIGGYINLFAYYGVSCLDLEKGLSADREIRLRCRFRSSRRSISTGIYLDCGPVLLLR